MTVPAPDISQRLGPYKALLGNPRYPKDETINSSPLLFEMVYALEEKYPYKQGKVEMVAELSGDTIVINENAPLEWGSPSGKTIPLRGLYTLHALLVKSLITRGTLSKESAHEFASRAQKAAIEALGESWSEYAAFVNSYLGDGVEPIRVSGKKIRAAVHELYSLVEIDYAHDMPTLAIYAKHNPLKLYFDRGFKKEWTLKSGETVNLIPYLVVHEVVEKCLLDEINFSERGYFRCHQVAQRLEQDAVRADGHSWREYQYDIMVPAIDAAYTKATRELASDMDTTPFEDMGETEIIEEIKHAARRLLEPKPFTVSVVEKGIYHLLFELPGRMSATMMRFQEFYESPEFRGKHFTREEYMSWYSERRNGASYTQDWDEGFNIPSSALLPFYEGYFSPLTEDESEVLQYFADKKDEQFYIIATAKESERPLESEKTVIDHEIAHALYYLNPEYKKEVDEVLKKVDTKPLKEFLTTNPVFGNYHEAVLDDEVHAYLAHSSAELLNHGLNTAPYKETIEKLQKIYKAYAPRG